MNDYEELDNTYHDDFVIPKTKKRKKGHKLDLNFKNIKLDYKKIAMIVGLILLIVVGIIVFSVSKNSSDSSVVLEDIIIDNESYAPNFSSDVYDYYLMTDNEKITVDCSLSSKTNISGCGETIDLSNYSDYIHEIVIDRDSVKEIYKIYIKVSSSDSDKNIVINSVDGITDKWTNESEMVTINASSDNGIIGYSIDNGVTFQTSSTFKVSKNDTLKIVVKDGEGNLSAVREVIVSNIDKTIPSAILIKEQSSSSEIVLKVISKDEESGVNSYSFNGGDYSSTDTMTITEKGEYYVTVKDNAGNVSDKISITIKDSDFVNKNEYSVTLYQNGSDTISSSFLKCSTNGDSCTVTLPNITRDNGIVLGWSDKEDSTDILYEVGEKITINSNLVLYAITTEDVVISFEKNGVDSISSVNEECTLYNNDSYCYVTAPNITYTGGKIIGWNNDSSSDTLNSSPGNLIKVNKSDIYYALAFKEYTVTFNINGADSISSTKESCRIENGKCLIDTPSIERDSADIIGWSEDKNSTSADISADTSIDVNSDKTYYAITKKNVIITFDKNGASSISSAKETCSYYNTDTFCSITTPTITRSGGNVIGWSVNSDTETSDVLQNTVLDVSSNQTYYAISYEKINITFDSNGASISSTSESCTYYNNSDGCVITTPTITRSGYTVVGFGVSSDATSKKLEASSKVTVKESKKYYAITYKTVTASFYKNTADSLGNCSTTTSYGCSASCKIYNKNASCSVSIPYIYSTGNEVQFFSTSTDEETTVGYSPANKLNLSSNIKLYAIVYNRYRSSTYTIIKTKLYGYTAVETESGCSSSVYNKYYSFMDTLYSRVPYIFRAAKITFVSTSSFTSTWGSYAGMTYGQNLGYRSSDIKCTETYSDYYIQTIVHELVHDWDSYYYAVYGTALSNMSDVKSLYNKYSSASTKPLRDYSYTNITEFVADMYAWYYFLYIDTSNQPSVITKNTYYPSDMKSVMEKYINIAKNGY